MQKMMPLRGRRPAPRPPRLAIALALALPALAHAQAFSAGDLIVSGSTYADVGQVSTISAGSLLAPATAGGAGTVATANGSFASVFNNAGADASFGVTSQIFLQDYSTTAGAAGGSFAAQYNLDPNLAVTSFSSKSELALNVTSGGALTFMAYDPTQSFSSSGTGGVAAVTTGGSNNLGLLDISNSNTPGLIDSTNPVNASAYRTVVQVNLNSLSFTSAGAANTYNLTGGVSGTNTNAYSGNNGRAAMLVNGQYYMVGNAGNGTKSSSSLVALAQNTGVQTITPGSTNPNSTVVGACTGTNVGGAGYQCGYNGSSSDKTGKDNNFRGLTLGADGNLYVSKGSGGNGVDTVYTVSGYTSPSTASVSITPGFATSTASTLGYTGAPFGLWQANSTTMYVAFEGDGNEAVTGSSSVTTGTTGSMGGLAKYSLLNGTWTLDYMVQNGLGSFSAGAVAGGDGTYYTDGLRNITGRVNANGTVTIYGVTSTVTDATVSKNWDQGANPDQIVAVNDTLASTTLGSSEAFSVVQTATAGTVFRGVALAPAVPEPQTYGLMIAGLGVAVMMARRRRRLGADA
jgi:hypothetical protein